MRIEFLQAGTGDSIWISHNKKNIVIDGGKSSAAIKARYERLPEDEIIDLLVVTHIDSDHIAGIIALIELMNQKGETARLKQVWFNFPKQEDTGEYSVAEGSKLSSMLCQMEGMQWNNNTSDLVGQPVSIGDITLHVLTPDYDVAYEYKPKSPEEYGTENADWNVPLKTLIENIDDDNLDEGGPNSQSIVILIECNGKRILLPGDSTPQNLLDALQRYKKATGESLILDLMKLPHHGSSRNVTESILNEVVCRDFVISTNVNRKYLFPNKETIAKLISYRRNTDVPINVFFNYQESADILGITDEEKTTYNINVAERCELEF